MPLTLRRLPGHDTWDSPGAPNENNSVSSGGLSPDLGDVWKHGCPIRRGKPAGSFGEAPLGRAMAPFWTAMTFWLCVRRPSSGMSPVNTGLAASSSS